MPTYWLSMHADYRCRHAGACCTSGWPIPLEISQVAPVRAAVEDGRIAVADPWLLPMVDAPAHVAGVLATGAQGRCVFHQPGCCSIHGVLGHAALPSACQHFPRVCLIDPRGVFVTLSHFCPTAASLLFDEHPVSIVEGPPALPGDVEPEGLDAREAWPPLLTERVLMDHDSYGAWERHMVNVLAGEDREATPEAAIERLRVDALGAANLSAEAVAKAEAPPLPKLSAANQTDRFDPLALFATACQAVPMPLRWKDVPRDFQREWVKRVEPTWSSWAPVVQRFLAAHAFGSWLAYQGRGLRTIVSGLDAAVAVLEVEVVRACQARDTALGRVVLHDAIRQTDLLLRHYADRQALADLLSRT